MVKTPEQSNYTSIKKRIDLADLAIKGKQPKTLVPLTMPGLFSS